MIKSSMTFRRGQTIIDPKSGQPLASQNLTAAGQHMRLYPVHLPPTFGEPSFFQKQSVYVVCTGIDRENHRVSWALAGFLSFFVYADRWQTLTDLGSGRVKYETIEVFDGFFAYLVKWFAGKNLVLGTRAMAEGLKQRAESAAR